MARKETGISTGIGISDTDRNYPAAVKLLGATSLVLGSGVAIGSRWVLTAAHLFRGQQLRVLVVPWGGQRRIRVRAIYWRHVSYDFGPPDSPRQDTLQWPDDVEQIQGESDELLLLELAEHLDGTEFAAPQATSLRPGRKLHVVGYGRDRYGGYSPASIPIVMRMVSVEGGGPRLAHCRSDPSESPGDDMPRKDDSGAAVFLANSQNLVGIHSSRLHGLPEGETACFIPIDTLALQWIVDRIGDGVTKAAHAPLPADKPRRFVLRHTHVCLTLTAGTGSLDGTWHVNGTSSRPEIIKLCDRIEIGTDGNGNTVFSLYRCGDIQPAYQGRVRMGGDSKVDKAWLEVTPDRTGDPEFFVFRRTDGWMPIGAGHASELTRRIHVEAFKKDTDHDKPPGNLETDERAQDHFDIVPCPDCRKWKRKRGDAEYDDDQDDEGDAYEG